MVKPLLLVFDNDNEAENDENATLDRYTFVLIDEKALSSKTVEYITASKTGAGVYMHGDGLKMSDLRQFCEFSIVNNAVKCMWMFDAKYKTFLGQLRSFGKIDGVLVKKIIEEFGDFNYTYPFVDIQLSFLTEKVNVPDYQEKVGYWYNYTIQHAQTHSGCKCKNCHKSFEGVNEETFVLQQYSGKNGARGNETEGYYQFCFECSKTHLAWLLHKNEQLAEQTVNSFIEQTLANNFFSNCDIPSGFHKLVEWIKKDIQNMDDDNNEINDGTIATSYRHFIERSIENLDN